MKSILKRLAVALMALVLIAGTAESLLPAEEFVMAAAAEEAAVGAESPTEAPTTVTVTKSGGVYRINLKTGYTTFLRPAKKSAKKVTVLNSFRYQGKIYTVKAIASKAFKGSNVTTLKIKSTTTIKISEDAFKGRKSKKALTTKLNKKLSKKNYAKMKKGITKAIKKSKVKKVTFKKVTFKV